MHGNEPLHDTTTANHSSQEVAFMQGGNHMPNRDLRHWFPKRLLHLVSALRKTNPSSGFSSGVDEIKLYVFMTLKAKFRSGSSHWNRSFLHQI